MSNNSSQKYTQSGKNRQSWPVVIVGGLILFLCLVCVSVTITLNFRPLYYMDMKFLHISEDSGYSDEVIKKPEQGAA